VSGTRGPGLDPAATGPVFVTRVAPGSGAANAGIQPGDEILAVNDIPAVLDGKPLEVVLRALGEVRPDQTIKITVRRPATGETLTREVKPVEFPRTPPQIESKLLAGDIAYVTLPGFGQGYADKVLQAIADLRKDKTLRGVILDLRGNGGGSPREVSRLLGGWTRSKATSYFCDVRDKCTPNSADATVPLVNLPLVALTDRNCASACDSFTSTVKDLRLGTLVGTRTAGAVSGPGAGFVLDDGSMVMLPKLHEIGANRELVDTIGVAPDHLAPLTAADVSAGRDPGVDKALTLLK
jgi:carboxyl-terminal processing protease